MTIQLFFIGLLVSTFGTMVGTGGGFILVPILLLLFRDLPPEVITAISLTCVFVNAISGSVALARKGRINYNAGITFSLAAVPGVFIGTWAVTQIAREAFEKVFGVFVLVLATYLLTRKTTGKASADGKKSRSFSLPLGIGISVVVGFLSSFLGIGGGIIHVPAMIYLLHFPVQMATATSLFILVVSSGVATLQHFFSGNLSLGAEIIWPLVPGVLLGAQLGVKLAERVHGLWIVRLLGLALILVGLRLLVL